MDSILELSAFFMSLRFCSVMGYQDILDFARFLDENAVVSGSPEENQ